MRKGAMVAALMVLLVVMLAPAALATKKCTDYPCYGIDNGEKLVERRGKRSPDKIYALRGNDTIVADFVLGDRDILFGGRGDDRLDAADVDGMDVVNGGPASTFASSTNSMGRTLRRAANGCVRLRPPQLKGCIKVRPAGCTTSGTGASGRGDAVRDGAVW